MMSFMRAINPENHYGANIAHWKLYTLDYTGEGTVLNIRPITLILNSLQFIVKYRGYWPRKLFITIFSLVIIY